MGYRMRYLLVDHKKRPLKLSEIEKGLRDADPDYSLEYEGEDETGEFGVLLYQGETCGLIEVIWSGEIFESEIEMYREEIQESESPMRSVLLELMDFTNALFVIQVFNSGEESEAIFKRINPVFDWLSQNRQGIMHADLEGFYFNGELIFETSR